MQQQMQQPPLEGIMNAMPQEAGGAQQGLSQEKGTMSLAVIIKLLMDQGIDPETAKQLAMQILQAFAQGGESGVEEFANQLGQQEQAQAMASGGIAGYGYRQGYGWGSIVRGIVGGAASAVKGVANVVKSVAKSPIGQIALAIAAPYAIGAMFPAFATLGGTGFMGAALRAGISNLAIQGITTGKFNPKQALMAAVGGGVAGEFFPQGGAPTDSLSSGDYMQYGSSAQNVTPTLNSGVVPSVQTGAEFASATPYDVSKITPQTGAEFASATPYDSIAGKVPITGTNPNTYNFSPLAKSIMDPTIGDRFSQFGDYLTSTGTNLMEDPIGTIGRGAGNVLQLARDNPLTTAVGAFGIGTQFRAPLAGEDPNEYNKLKAEHDAKVGQYITQYGGKANVYSPGNYGLYARENAVDPFANMSSYRRAANGGRIGYEYGSMPMGEPRTNPEGIMELDYRRKGGFVPPVGIKEKADDIPAMLSNNEFVFTANAVRNAGRGDVNKGAKRMYGLMKQLEAGGMV